MHVMLKNPDESLDLVVLTPEAEALIAEAVAYSDVVARRVEIGIRAATLRSIISSFAAYLRAADAELETSIAHINTDLARAIEALNETDADYAAQARAINHAALEAGTAALDKRNNEHVRLIAQVNEANSELSALGIDQQKIEIYDHVKSRIGLSSQEHGIVLKLLAKQDVDEGKISHRPQILDQDVVAADVALPSDDFFRGAWVWSPGAAQIDVRMDRALGIAQDNIRRMRAPKLIALDVEFQRAVESGDTTKQAQVAADKQRLREAPADSRLLSAATPEALKLAMEAVGSEL